VQSESKSYASSDSDSDCNVTHTVNKLVLRPIKSGDVTEPNTSALPLCLIRPTSVKSPEDSLDEMSSEEVEYDYGFRLHPSQSGVPLPVLPNLYDPDSNAMLMTKGDSVTTDSSGDISNSMLSPKFQRRFVSKMSPSSKKPKLPSNEHPVPPPSAPQPQQSQRPQVLEEEKEFIAPLSVIEVARSLEDSLVNTTSPTIEMHRYESNHNATVILPHQIWDRDTSANSHISYEVSYTLHSHESPEHMNTDPHGTYYSTKSGRLFPMKSARDREAAVSPTSAPTVAITRILNEEEAYQQQCHLRRMGCYFSTQQTDCKQERIPIPVSMKCQSLPVLSQETVTTMVVDQYAASRMLRHSEPEKYGTEDVELKMRGLTPDMSGSRSCSVDMEMADITARECEYAVSAPQDAVNVDVERRQRERVRWKSAALMDMCVNYGWTDETLLDALHDLRRFSQ